jgi:hypothetical protein
MQVNTHDGYGEAGAVGRVAGEVRCAALADFFAMERSLRAAAAHLAAAEATVSAEATGRGEAGGAELPARAGSAFCTTLITRLA